MFSFKPITNNHNHKLVGKFALVHKKKFINSKCFLYLLAVILNFCCKNLE